MSRKAIMQLQKNCIKIIRMFKALERLEARITIAKFVWRVRNMAKLNDYRMRDRLKKRDKKANRLDRRRVQRDEVKKLHMYFLGGLLNKFYSKFKRQDMTTTKLIS